MIGPSYGHNIKMFLDFFEVNNSVCFTLGYLDKGDFHTGGSYKNIQFYKINKSFSGIRNYRLFLKKDWDLIWIHRGANLKFLVLTYLFKTEKSKLILNIWGEQLPRMIKKGGFKSMIYKKLFWKIDYIQCNWYGTYELFTEISSKFNLVVFPWGLQNEYFSNTSPTMHSFTYEFINNLPKTKIKFFIPRSIIRINNHHILIKSAKILKEQGYHNFVIYLWHGNVFDDNYVKEINTYIKKNDLNEFVKIVEHPFLSAFDIKEIWKAMDCGIVFGSIDQLSTTLLEPMLYKKELIASNIQPYKIFEKKYNINLDLSDTNSKSLGKRMEKILQGFKTPKNILEKREQLIKRHFNFNSNITTMLNFYSKTIYHT